LTQLFRGSKVGRGEMKFDTLLGVCGRGSSCVGKLGFCDLFVFGCEFSAEWKLALYRGVVKMEFFWDVIDRVF